MATEANQTIYPQIESQERGGEQWWVETYSSGGLTKREYFAGLAMQAILSKTFNHMSIDDSVTIGAVMYADKLIDELNKRQ